MQKKWNELTIVEKLDQLADLLSDIADILEEIADQISEKQTQR
jgi:hypothetical protein